MKKITSIAAALFMLLCAMLPAALSGAERIATVDLEKIFREYYKSKIAEEAIRAQGENYRAYLLQLNDRRNNLLKDLRQASFNARNMALSSEEMRKAAGEVAKIEAAIKETTSEMELYRESSNTAMRDLEQKKRKEIMDDIRKAISRQAAASGFLYVFDSSGRTMNEQPALLLAPAKSDLTRAVIDDLNRTAVKTRDVQPAVKK